MTSTTHVWAAPADMQSVVEEHSMGETIASAHLTANPDGYRCIVEYGKRASASGDRQVAASILLNLAHELVTLALDDLWGPAAFAAREAAQGIECAGHLQREAVR